MFNIQNFVSRTPLQDVQLLTQLFSILQPQELYFLIELNQRWSIYDPNRIQNITSIVRQTFAYEHKESHIDYVLKYVNSSNSIQLLPSLTVEMALLQLDQALHLNPYQSVCPICTSTLSSEMADVLSVEIHTLKGAVHKGKVFFAACKHTNTSFKLHPITYVYPNFFRQKNIATFTSESLQKHDTVYLGGKYAFERTLIENYTCQLISRASSWLKFVDGLNLGAFNTSLTDKKIDWRKRLAMTFIKYKVIEYDLSIGSPTVSVPSSSHEFDLWIWDQYPRLLSSFVYLWSNHKTIIRSCGSCCSQCIIVDGHQKCRRRVCREKNVRISTEEFDSLTIGCCRTPNLGSHFCELHQMSDENISGKNSVDNKKTEKKRKTIKNTIVRRLRQRGFGATNCRTIKERSSKYVEKCSRSFGILAAVTNCKIIITFSEIFRSETLREIISLLCSTIRASNFNFPKCGVYDDGCHLVEFIRNHYDQDLKHTQASKTLYETKFSVDRTHFRGHIGRWCRVHMNPDKNKMLHGVNTQAAEQLFSWVKGYANILSNLGWRRMPIYLLLLFHYKNLERMNIRPTHKFNIIASVPIVPNINLAHTADQNQEQNHRSESHTTTVNKATTTVKHPMTNHQPATTHQQQNTKTDFRVADIKQVYQMLKSMEKQAKQKNNNDKKKEPTTQNNSRTIHEYTLSIAYHIRFFLQKRS